MFNSFISAGFECTAAKNEERRRLDLLAATAHDTQCENDYLLLKQIGINTVREGFQWSLIDNPNGYNFKRYENIIKIGKKLNIQQIWDLNHFDYPDHIDPFSDYFVDKFAEYAKECMKLLRTYIKDTIYISPINEISFFAWIGGQKGYWAPYGKKQKDSLLFKIQLVKASIAAIKTIKALDQNVKFILIDPLMRRVVKRGSSKKAQSEVDTFNNVTRFEAWDMISGSIMPELGGHKNLFDFIGVNYYMHNQEWVATLENGSLTFTAMDWHSSGRVSFAYMLKEVFERYKKPIFVSETGSFGQLRYKWWRRLLTEIDEAVSMKIPICGVCAYPVIDRPENAGYLMPYSGLWDFNHKDRSKERVPHVRSIKVIKDYLKKLNNKLPLLHL